MDSVQAEEDIRLIDVSQCGLETGHLVLSSFDGTDIPSYAILSHRWQREEVLFADIIHDTVATREGYAKLKRAILQARADGYLYLWADTCCIDKRSSAILRGHQLHVELQSQSSSLLRLPG
jgi:hypothetical protein